MTSEGPQVGVATKVIDLVLTEVRDQDSIGIAIVDREVEFIGQDLRNRDILKLSWHARYRRTERESILERPDNRIIEIVVENFPQPDGMPQSEIDRLKGLVQKALEEDFPGATIKFE